MVRPDRTEEARLIRLAHAGAPDGAGQGGSRPWAHVLADRVKVTLAPPADDIGDADLVQSLRTTLAALRKTGRGHAA
jgi:hypothetical protein